RNDLQLASLDEGHGVLTGVRDVHGPTISVDTQAFGREAHPQTRQLLAVLQVYDRHGILGTVRGEEQIRPRVDRDAVGPRGTLLADDRDSSNELGLFRVENAHP